ncbi:cupin domain-containing protein [Streptococcus dentiloxodontae]
MTAKEELLKDLVFAIGDSNQDYQDFFVGESFLNTLALAPDGSLQVGQVTFEPGCRNNWHIHKDGYQILLVTGGHGLYQEEGKPAKHLKSGDVVITKEGIKHWHGAQADSWFSHIAITAGSGQFFEPVSEADYQKANEG